MKYELTNGVYKIAEFEKVVEECKAFIEREGNLALIITNDEDKKLAKKSRTDIRKKKEEVATLRKNLNTAIMGEFNAQAKELENLLNEADDTLKEHISAYEKAGKPEEPTVFSTIVSSYDEKAIEKVKAYALKLGCGVK